MINSKFSKYRIQHVISRLYSNIRYVQNKADAQRTTPVLHPAVFKTSQSKNHPVLWKQDNDLPALRNNYVNYRTIITATIWAIGMHESH